jgi:hypothetical protein
MSFNGAYQAHYYRTRGYYRKHDRYHELYFSPYHSSEHDYFERLKLWRAREDDPEDSGVF